MLWKKVRQNERSNGQHDQCLYSSALLKIFRCAGPLDRKPPSDPEVMVLVGELFPLLGPSEHVPAPITAALYTRFRSREDHTFAEQLISAMRQKFGGHVEQPVTKVGGYLRSILVVIFVLPLGAAAGNTVGSSSVKNIRCPRSTTTRFAASDGASFCNNTFPKWSLIRSS